ncbi:MAG: pantoate--beta-alanine ligase [Pseudomonadota bacterium]|nr:pantoate--beta-alanine ligase [Pseudomonadota bacterium]
MPSKIEIVRTVEKLRKKIFSWRKKGFSIGLVPTMGALHDGHFSLVQQSISSTDKTITTLFVNPKQFGPNEDLITYPTDEVADISALDSQGVDMIFIPNLEEMYPVDFKTEIIVPGIGEIMEGVYRPGFFIGVATVVAKLLIQSLPDRAFFGEKDLQQLYVIKQMVTDLDIPVEVVGCPIIREQDGLALSSRNIYLSKDERLRAVELYKTLDQIGEKIVKGELISSAIEEGKKRLFNSGFSKVDYIAVCENDNLTEIEYFQSTAYVLCAAWIGRTRLIDNIRVG